MPLRQVRRGCRRQQGREAGRPPRAFAARPLPAQAGMRCSRNCPAPDLCPCFAARFGSGWAWLVVGQDGKLMVTSTANQVSNGGSNRGMAGGGACLAGDLPCYSWARNTGMRADGLCSAEGNPSEFAPGGSDMHPSC